MYIKSIFSFAISHFFVLNCLSSQISHPEKTELFKDTEVARVDILIDEEDFNLILTDNLYSDELFPATFIFTNETIQDTLDNVGFRVRGNTSRTADKKSFKIDINAFVKKREFYGVKAINLNGQHNDPTISRAKISADIAEWLDVPSMRTNHVRLYINGDYRGLYTNVEHIDQLFIEKRFGNFNGNLYKCLYPADLNYENGNPNSYKMLSNGRRIYELKNNNEKDDYSDLAKFINVLNNTPNGDLKCKLEEVFNVDAYLRAMVLDILIGNWDGPIYNQNNFYLYHNESTGKMEYIPYDLDNTLGIDWLNRDWGERNIYAWKPSGANRPIYSKIIGISDYKARFTQYMEEAINTFFTSGMLYTYIEDMKNMLSPYVENDPFYPRDYGFDLDDFARGFNGALPYFQTPYGIRSYIEKRSNTVMEQLNQSELPISFYDYKANRPYENENLSISIRIESDQPLSTVELCYSFEGAEEVCIDLIEVVENEYKGEVNSFNNTGNLAYRIKVKNTANLVSFFPTCDRINLYVEEAEARLVINEFMAKNNSTTSDITDNFKDWIEIYNPGSKPVYLGNKYLSDNEDNPDKWPLPPIVTSPNEYVIIWAGDDVYQGSLQANFKLSAGGEFIGLFDKSENNFALIDGLDFSEQTADISFGRLPNGDGPFVRLVPTPGAQNEMSTLLTPLSSDNISIFPNPTAGKITIPNEIIVESISIYNQQGRLMKENQGSHSMDISELSDGLYFVKIRDIGGKLHSIKIVKI